MKKPLQFLADTGESCIFLGPDSGGSGPDSEKGWCLFEFTVNGWLPKHSNCADGFICGQGPRSSLPPEHLGEYAKCVCVLDDSAS